MAPGSPWQNGFVKSFHGRLRDEFLKRHEFESVAAANEAKEGDRRTSTPKHNFNKHALQNSISPGPQNGEHLNRRGLPLPFRFRQLRRLPTVKLRRFAPRPHNRDKCITFTDLKLRWKLGR
ncbi:integrase core domain-containing protein [Singulisphaera acidiphila]|uniref:integrase core domain-containing protein n=1 Tax=Singulisphaera acidiphila TaxID=466153 RepID=UPI0002471267